MNFSTPFGGADLGLFQSRRESVTGLLNVKTRGSRGAGLWARLPAPVTPLFVLRSRLRPICVVSPQQAGPVSGGGGRYLYLLSSSLYLLLIVVAPPLSLTSSFSPSLTDSTLSPAPLSSANADCPPLQRLCLSGSHLTLKPPICYEDR